MVGPYLSFVFLGESYTLLEMNSLSRLERWQKWFIQISIVKFVYVQRKFGTVRIETSSNINTMLVLAGTVEIRHIVI